MSSVANTVGHPPNWASLKSPPTGKKKKGEKTAGGLPRFGLFFICLPTTTLFFLKICQFPVNSFFFNLFKVQKHSFHQFQEKISIDYPLYTEGNNLIVFLLNLGDFDYFTADKHPNLGNWAYKSVVFFEVTCREQRRQFAVVRCSEVLATLSISVK